MDLKILWATKDERVLKRKEELNSDGSVKIAARYYLEISPSKFQVGFTYEDLVRLYQAIAAEIKANTEQPAQFQSVVQYNLEKHDPKDCNFTGYGHCPGCCTDYYLDGSKRKASYVDSRQFGPHKYPGDPKYNDGDCYTSDCSFKCGCWAGPNMSGGPVDPFGPCPNNPKSEKEA